MTPFDRRMLLLTIIVVAVIFGYWMDIQSHSQGWNEGRGTGIAWVWQSHRIGNETLGQLLYQGIIESIEEGE